MQIKNELNKIKDDNLSCWFYALNYIYCINKYKNENIVCERGFLSNYAWKHNEDNEFIVSSVIQASKKPDVVIFLTIDQNVLMKRLKNRSENDSDIYKVQYSNKINSVIRNALIKNDIEFYEIDRTNDTIEGTLEKILAILDERSKNEVDNRYWHSWRWEELRF